MSRKPTSQARSAAAPPDLIDRAALSHALANIRLLGEPAWASALAGDAAAAIGAALRAKLDPRCGERRRLLTMAALEACATAGDPAARVVFAYLKRPRL